MGLAILVAGWSKDASTQVGAVITDADHRLVSLGFNGPPKGADDARWMQDRDTKLAVTLHAEHNAILFARRPLEGCTLYTYPLPPCSHCAAQIVQTGIGRVVVPDLEIAQRWRHSVGLGEELLRDAGVEICRV